MILVWLALAGVKSAGAAAITTMSASLAATAMACGQIGGRGDRLDLGARRGGQTDVGRDQADLGAPQHRGAGQRPAHQARRGVAEEPHRVEVLAGAAGADHDPEAGHVLAGGPSAMLGSASTAAATANSSAGSGSRPGPASGPVSRPDVGSHDDGAAAPERGDVGLGRGVQPHLGVHGGREDHRAVRGQQHIGQQVVGPA